MRARRAREADVGGDDGHLGAERGGLLGQREAHAPGAAVADEAHRVDRLARTAGGDEHLQAVPGAPARRDDGLDGGQQVRRLGQAPDAPLVPGAQRAGAGVDDDHAALAQEREVGLRGRVLVHVVVHRRRDEDGAGGGQRGRGQQVVGQAVGQLGDRVGGRRRDQEGVGVADQLEVAERVVLRRRLIGERAPGGVALELVGEDRGSGEGRERRGARRSAGPSASG